MDVYELVEGMQAGRFRSMLRNRLSYEDFSEYRGVAIQEIDVRRFFNKLLRAKNIGRTCVVHLASEFEKNGFNLEFDPRNFNPFSVTSEIRRHQCGEQKMKLLVIETLKALIAKLETF